MSLRQWVGDAVWKRIEALPSWQAQTEREERLLPTEDAAEQFAYSALDDEAARLQLKSTLESDPAVLKEAAIEMSRFRGDFIRDRAYRLLSAAASATPVQPIPPERRELFAEEEVLGRTAIEQAFMQLAQRQPGLLEAKRRAQARDMSLAASERAEAAVQIVDRAERERREAGREDELLDSSLASSIVHQYLEQLAGVPGMGSPSNPYFEERRRVVVRGVIGGARRAKR